MLSAVQEEIINTEGNLIVRASAGTGKTHTLVKKIEKEISENTTHRVIGAITFTIKAAKEIRERLTCEVREHFIGTNTSFAIEEIIKPFIKDVYGVEYDKDFDTDYSQKYDNFNDCLEVLKDDSVLSAYNDNKKNFVFQLAKYIVENSECCRLYLKSKYFKIYIDEYQDCDKDMNDFFMYMCDDLEIETFIVGDEKQSIYIWRGAYPDAFINISKKANFKTLKMYDNHRSCQQIQNYSNIFSDDTNGAFVKTDNVDNIIFIQNRVDIWSKVVELIDPSKTSAILRFSNENAENGAIELKNVGLEYTFIPKIPIADITTESAWLYMAIANYCIFKEYSVYDFIDEMPVEADESNNSIKLISRYIDDINACIKTLNETEFYKEVRRFAEHLNLSTKSSHLVKLYNTITEDKYHVAFNIDKFSHIATTVHSSKGLEFEQVILFAEDYRLNEISSICNHYVAATRAKNKLIIIYDKNKMNSIQFINNLQILVNNANLALGDLFIIDKI